VRGKDRRRPKLEDTKGRAQVLAPNHGYERMGMEMRGRVGTGGRELNYSAGREILIDGGQSFFVYERGGRSVD
jgi:hypothetical protein